MFELSLVMGRAEGKTYSGDSGAHPEGAELNVGTEGIDLRGIHRAAPVVRGGPQPKAVVVAEDVAGDRFHSISSTCQK